MRTVLYTHSNSKQGKNVAMHYLALNAIFLALLQQQRSDSHHDNGRNSSSGGGGNRFLGSACHMLSDHQQDPKEGLSMRSERERTKGGDFLAQETGANLTFCVQKP